tara:strand:+ start:1424 stop:2008 length:585 start_codon:yes stop_codon:yes gene_type:complete
MIPNFIRLGIETILRIFCEKIIIKDIQIFNKNCKFNEKIDELYIKAENIIFNKINISNINIKIKDINLKLKFNKNFFVEDCDATIFIRLTEDNINKTLLNKKWNRLKTSIESFISMSFQNIEIKNKSIHFLPTDELSNTSSQYTLKYDKNTISLVNNIYQEKLSILNDENIIVNNLLFNESYIELELTSTIIFN